MGAFKKILIFQFLCEIKAVWKSFKKLELLGIE